MDTAAVKNIFDLYGQNMTEVGVANYGNGVRLGDSLNYSVDLLTDEAHKGLLKSVIHTQYSKFDKFFVNMPLYNLRQFGGVRKTTSAYTVGHKVQDKLIKSFTATGLVGASAGAPVILTVSTAYSIPGYIVADIGDVIAIGQTGVLVEVIGVANGGVLNARGLDVNRAPITSATYNGATTTSHKLVVEPLQSEIIPAVTTSDSLVVLYNTRGDGACPNNYYRAKMPLDAKFGFSLIRTDYKETDNTGATELAIQWQASNGQKYKFLSDLRMANLHLTHLYKVNNAILWGERKTNTADPDREKKQNNGIAPQIIANGGLVKPYVQGAGWTFADTKDLMLKLRDRGVTNATLWSGSDLTQQVMDSVAGSSFFVNNYRININSGNTLNPGYCAVMDVPCITYGGVTLTIKDLPNMSDPDNIGRIHGGDGIVIPNNITAMTDLNGQDMRTTNVNVWFKQNKRGQVFDENFSWQTGGASVKQDSACDVENTIHKTELCTEVVGVEQFAFIKRALA